jgi:periplasmic divalent cation tolerance protein
VMVPPWTVAESAVRVVLVTLPDEAAAEELVGRLVHERVVACGNIVPGLTSIYWWRGEVERAREVLVIFKTTPAGAERLIRRVPELHPYDVPEVLVLPVEAGHAPYLDWVAGAVGAESDDTQGHGT